MNKKKIIILILLIIFLIGITVFKYAFYDPLHKKYYFNSIKVANIKNDLIYDSNLDSENYKNNIITEDLLTIDYSFFEEKESITGKIYIEDGYLYITDINKNSIKKLSNIKFKTMYKTDYEYSNGIYLYLISNNLEPYVFKLSSNNIKNAEISKIYTKYKVKNFTNLKLNFDMFGSANAIFVLADDNKIYDLTSGLRYRNDIKSLYNKFYIYNDNTISNIYGKVLNNRDGKNYKIKYIYQTYDDNDFSGKNTIIIITTDNNLIYLSNNNDLVYEFQEKVKNIDFNVKYPYIKSPLKITFMDESYIEFKASCNQFYCNCKI